MRVWGAARLRAGVVKSMMGEETGVRALLGRATHRAAADRVERNTDRVGHLETSRLGAAVKKLLLWKDDQVL